MRERQKSVDDQPRDSGKARPYQRGARGALNVRYGSKADIRAGHGDVRFTPESGHPRVRTERPLSAKNRHDRVFV